MTTYERIMWLLTLAIKLAAPAGLYIEIKVHSKEEWEATHTKNN